MHILFVFLLVQSISPVGWVKEQGKASCDLSKIFEESSLELIVCKCTGVISKNKFLPNVLGGGARIDGMVECQFTTKYRYSKKKLGSYVGNSKNGKFHGKGKLSILKKNMESEDMPIPKIVKFDGNWKEGEIYCASRVKKCMVLYKSGNSYTGGIISGKFHGKGTYKFTGPFSGGDIYTGDWKQGKKHGQGTYEWNRGKDHVALYTKYVGSWKDDKRTGYGKYTWSSGSYYEGGFVDSKREGKGTYVWSDGRKHVGIWKNNYPKGNGKREWPDGSWYDGAWKGHDFHGFGTKMWPDGSRYEGEWVSARMEGEGRYYCTEYDYFGSFRHDKMDGMGVMYMKASGDRYQGLWESGKKVSMILRKKNGERFQLKYDSKEKVVQKIRLPDYEDDDEKKKKKEKNKKETGKRLQYEIECSEIDRIHRIGSTSGFGEIWKAKWTGSGGGAIVAVKEITLLDGMSKDVVFEEYKFHIELLSPFVLRTFGICLESDKKFSILMELMDTDVHRFVEKNRLTEKEKFQLMKKMTQALHVIHSRGILHRDIKSFNYLISNGKVLTFFFKFSLDGKILNICDFGLSKIRPNSEVYVKSKGQGTYAWMAPELFSRNSGRFSVYSDIYALGITFYEVLFETIPFSWDLGAVIAAKLKGEIPTLKKKNTKVSSHFVELLKKMLAKQPSERPDTNELLKWFDKNQKRVEKGKKFFRLDEL